MEHQEQEFYAPRENKQSRYDKRLILKIVREVEAGLPRKEANRIYELRKFFTFTTSSAGFLAISACLLLWVIFDCLTTDL